jgi:chromosome segregation ATPase
MSRQDPRPNQATLNQHSNEYNILVQENRRLVASITTGKYEQRIEQSLYQQEIHRLRLQNEHFRQDLVQYQAAIKPYNLELTRLRLECEMLKQDLQNIQIVVKHYGDSLEKSETTVNELKVKHQEVLSEKSRLVVDNQHLCQKIDQDEQTMQRLLEDVAICQLERHQKNVMMNEAEARTRELKLEVDDCQARLREAEVRRQNLTDKLNSCHEADAMIQQLTRENMRLRRQLRGCFLPEDEGQVENEISVINK